MIRIHPWHVYYSLISRSPIIRAGMGFGLGLATFTTLSVTSVFFIILAAFLAMGLGVSVRNYQNWEAGALIPGLRAAQAAAAIQICCAMSLITILISFALHEFNLFWIGLPIAMVSVSMLFGHGNTFATLFFVVPAVCVIVVTQSNYLQSIVELFTANPFRTFDIFGGILVLVGCCSLYQFWRQATISTGSTTRETSASHARSAKPIQQKANPNPTPMKIQEGDAWWRLVKMLNPYNFRDRLTMWLIGLSILFVYALMFLARGNEQFDGLIQFYTASILICLPAVSLMLRLPQTFERAWTMGVAKSRKSTAKILIILSGVKGAFMAAWMSIGLLIKVPFEPIPIMKMACLVLISIALAAICLWLVSPLLPILGWTRRRRVFDRHWLGDRRRRNSNHAD